MNRESKQVTKFPVLKMAKTIDVLSHLNIKLDNMNMQTDLSLKLSAIVPRALCTYSGVGIEPQYPKR